MEPFDRDDAGLGPEELVRIHHVASVTRAVDERLWTLSRQGRAGFVLTARGHEIAQIASAAALRIGTDSAWLYYRDLGVGIALGITPYEIFLGALAKATDPHSGGRQLTSHFSSRSLRIGSTSSEVGAHLPHAVGAAYATKVLGDDAVAVCWFGDGASSEGAAHEAMNLAAVGGLPVVFICENNGFAISVPASKQMAAPVAARAAGYGMPGATVDGTDVDAVHAAARGAVEHARAGNGPSLLELLVPRLVPHSSQDDEKYRSDADRAAAAERDPLLRLRSRLLDDGIRDQTALDAVVEEVHGLVAADLHRALDAPEPEPGGPSVAVRRRPSPARRMTAVNMIEAVRDALAEEMERDATVVLLGQDVGVKGGVFKASEGLQERFGPLRVLDTPVSEIVIAGAAIGAAMMGLRPVAEFQFADYMHPAYDQIVSQAATMRWRSVGAWGVPVVFRAPFGAVTGGGIYHSQSVEAPYCHVPGLKVVAPATPADTKGLLKAAIRDDDPVVFFEHKRSYRLAAEEPGDGVVPIGVARLDREGSDLSIVTYAGGVGMAREAADALAADGIEVEILDLRTLHPLDHEAIARTVQRTGRLLVLHEANKTMGVGAEVAAFAAEELFGDLDAPIRRIAGADSYPSYNTVEQTATLPSVASVVAAARDLAAY